MHLLLFSWIKPYVSTETTAHQTTPRPQARTVRYQTDQNPNLPEMRQGKIASQSLCGLRILQRKRSGEHFEKSFQEKVNNFRSMKLFEISSLV